MRHAERRLGGADSTDRDRHKPANTRQEIARERRNRHLRERCACHTDAESTALRLASRVPARQTRTLACRLHSAISVVYVLTRGISRAASTAAHDWIQTRKFSLRNCSPSYLFLFSDSCASDETPKQPRMPSERKSCHAAGVGGPSPKCAPPIFAVQDDSREQTALSNFFTRDSSESCRASALRGKWRGYIRALRAQGSLCSPMQRQTASGFFYRQQGYLSFVRNENFVGSAPPILANWGHHS